MMDDVFREYWPLPSGLDFAKGGFAVVAAAVETEVRRFIRGEPLSKHEMTVRDMNGVFGVPSFLDNVGLHYFIVPTHSAWTAIWTSTFLCSGYDSLSSCLTKNHDLETIHFSSSNGNAWFQPGTVISHRTKIGERHVAAIQEDTRWIFHESGTPLPEENLTQYRKRKIRDRWNSEALLMLLCRIGIRPWSVDYYDLSRPVIHLERVAAPLSVNRITRQEFKIRLEKGGANQSPDPALASGTPTAGQPTRLP
jgi:hypothetical protein